MLDNQTIDNLIGVEESFHASYKLNEILADKQKREMLFDEFLKVENDLNYDWFTNYFQSEHADRKNKKQDYTPDGVVRVANDVLPISDSNADICAGTGGLTIKRWSTNNDMYCYCEEFSDRALPFLIFNLAIRNIDGCVVNGDSLSRTFKKIYRLKKSDKYSDIQEIDSAPDRKYKTVIMNPPYSMPWIPNKEWIEQDRFKGFEVLAPKSKADYAFLLTGLDMLDSDGVMSVILPHGVLFRSAAEGKIRKSLLEKNYIDAIVGLPGKLFLNTDIPTCVLVLNKQKIDTNVLFIAAEDEFRKNKSNNVLEDEHVEKIINTYTERKSIERYSQIVAYSDIQDNDYNLNIPRYVDKFVPEPTVPLSEIAEELAKIDAEILETQKSALDMMQDLTTNDLKLEREINVMIDYFRKKVQ